MAAGVPCSPFRSATPHSTASRARRFPLQMIFNCSIFDGNHCSNLDGSGHPGGVGQLWGGIANFLAVIFLLAAASRAALFALVSSFLAV